MAEEYILLVKESKVVNNIDFKYPIASEDMEAIALLNEGGDVSVSGVSAANTIY